MTILKKLTLLLTAIAFWGGAGLSQEVQAKNIKHHLVKKTGHGQKWKVKHWKHKHSMKRKDYHQWRRMQLMKEREMATQKAAAMAIPASIKMTPMI